MSSPPRGLGDKALFFDSPEDIRSMPDVQGKPAKSQPKARSPIARGAKSRKGLVDAVVNGERVLLVEPRATEPREKAIEIQIRVALSAAGVLVWKHHVDNRATQTGLGLGTADLICCVPPFGRLLGIEVKRPSTRTRTSAAQKAWLAVVRRFNGVAGVATSVEEAMALVDEARRLPE
jgi:hypothetical protein